MTANQSDDDDLRSGEPDGDGGDPAVTRDVDGPRTAPPPGGSGRHRHRRGGPPPRPRLPPSVDTPAGVLPGRHVAAAALPAGGPPDLAAAAPSRAGRNLPAAIGVGLGLGALIVVPLVTYRPAFVVVLAAAVAVGTWELVRAIGSAPDAAAHPPLLPLLAGGVGTVALAWTAGAEALLLGLLLTVVAALAWRIPDGPAGFERDLTASVLVATYVPFLAGFAVLLVAPDDGAVRILAFVATVVCSDVGGYAAGVLFGRHPMAPTVSPKKSWEGTAGSLVACAAAGTVFLTLAFDGTWWQGALFGLAIAAAATLGDLAESMVKRDLAVKDMGTLLPGHGGLMDRLDSLLVAAPVAWLLLEAFLSVG